MNDLMFLILSLLVGVLLGGFFFGGLWWTVQKVLPSKNPAVWLLGSQLLRTSIVLLGFYSVSAGHWERMLACLLGFMMVRFSVTARNQIPAEVSVREMSVRSPKGYKL